MQKNLYLSQVHACAATSSNMQIKCKKSVSPIHQNNLNVPMLRQPSSETSQFYFFTKRKHIQGSDQNSATSADKKGPHPGSPTSYRVLRGACGETSDKLPRGWPQPRSEPGVSDGPRQQNACIRTAFARLQDVGPTSQPTPART